MYKRKGKAFIKDPTYKQQYRIDLFLEKYKDEIDKGIIKEAGKGYIDEPRRITYVSNHPLLISLMIEMGIKMCTCCARRPRQSGLTFLCMHCYKHADSGFDNEEHAGGTMVMVTNPADVHIRGE